MTNKSIRKIFSRIGFSLTAVLVIGSFLQYLAAKIVTNLPGGDQWIRESSLGMMLISFVPLYVLAFPLGFLLLKKLPSDSRKKEAMGIKELVSYGLMCLPVMYLGNTIGTILSKLLSGGTATNAIEDLLTGNILVEIIFLTILAPLFEELLFRKMIIDKTVHFGERTAVLFSALMFGLFHGNLFQFFYTFGVGFLWAYIYTKTRRFSYVFILHAAFNFIGGILPSMLMKYMGADSLAALETMDMNAIMENTGAIAAYGIYSAGLIFFAAAGCILLVRKRKQFSFVQGEVNAGIKEIWLNPGMLLFAVLILFTFIIMLLA